MRDRRTPLLPPTALLVPLLLKPMFFWLFVRGALAGVTLATTSGAGAGAVAIVPAPSVSVGVLVVVSVMVLADMRILRERTFFDNLGIGKLRSAALVVIVLEAVSGVVGRALLV